MFQGIVLPGSSLLNEYRRYRNVATALNHRIMNVALDKATLDRAGKWLGITKRGVLVFDSDDETSVLMDYALYEVRKHGKSVVQRYQEEGGEQDQIEQELLAAMVAAKAGLFRVESTSRQMSNVTLSDAIDGSSVTLTDIGFSQTLTAGPMVFFRPVQLSLFTMTSGIAFVFPGEMEHELRDLYRKWHDLDSSERYARFFKLNRNRGLTTEYAPVGKS